MNTDSRNKFWLWGVYIVVDKTKKKEFRTLQNIKANSKLYGIS